MILNQRNFPKCWSLFQKIVGGTKAKQQLAIQYYEGQNNVLEVGCSVGNVSEIFTQFKNVSFTGIDIDTNALAIAIDRFAKYKNFRFTNMTLAELAEHNEAYDYLMISNILHHVDDSTAMTILSDAQKLMTTDSIMFIMEPEKKKPGYSLMFRLFYLLEQGQYRRTKTELLEILERSGLCIEKYEEVMAAPDSMPSVMVGKLQLIKARRGGRSGGCSS